MRIKLETKPFKRGVIVYFIEEILPMQGKDLSEDWHTYWLFCMIPMPKNVNADSVQFF